ncbi:bifunctional 4-hydroxy-2-oxoglutarate aldolase/2-dehydro-3-deoxy-phosphogluconate aldolase, partial [Enterococcus faecalis]
EVPIFPGTATPREILPALAFGFRVVIFFPAVIYRRLNAIYSLCGPFFVVLFFPTGGFDVSIFFEFVLAKEVLAVGG